MKNWRKRRKNGEKLPVAMFLLGENRGEKGGLYAKVDYDDGRKHQTISGRDRTAEGSEVTDTR